MHTVDPEQQLGWQGTWSSGGNHITNVIEEKRDILQTAPDENRSKDNSKD